MIPATPIKLGQRVKCELTGIQGLVSSIAVEENGNIRIGIQPVAQDNKLPESFFADQASITVLDDGITSKSAPFQDTEFGIGQQVADKYSDYAGTITMLAWYLNGCVHAVVTSPVLDRARPVNTILTTTRLVAIAAAPDQTDEPPTGGPITTTYARL